MLFRYRTLLFFLLALTSASLYAQLPDDFTDEVVVDNWFHGIGIVFSEEGQGYVWDKSGLINHINENDEVSSDPVLDIREEVGYWGDHGLLSVVLDPAFSINGHIYLFYQVDRHYLLYHGTAQYHPDSTITNEASIGRITRYTLSTEDYRTVRPDSRKILLGESIDNGVPLLHSSHGTCSLVFGTDGTLFAGSGDGASFNGWDLGTDSTGAQANQALADGIITPQEDIGRYRSQYLKSLNGKILRLDPRTGDGVPSNPFYDSAAPRSPESRIWALGFRNPFRFSLIPGTGVHDPDEGNPGYLIVGDVGSGKYEELNIIKRGGQNFGWPVYEGYKLEWGTFVRPHLTNPLSRNPLFGNGCEEEYLEYYQLLAEPSKDSIVCIPNPCDENQCLTKDNYAFQHSYPEVAWGHERYNPGKKSRSWFFDENDSPVVVELNDPASRIESDTFSGICSIGGVVYDGENFPEKYRGAYFQADYARWIKVFYLNEKSEVTKIEPFSNQARRVISFTVHPVNGCLYYMNYLQELHKICYGGNVAPTAIIEADTVYGGSSLRVQFDGSNSFHQQETPFDYLWDFQDGTTSTQANPVHTFNASGDAPNSFMVTLTLTDSVGLQDQAERLISLNNSPPKVAITSLEDGDKYSMKKFSLLQLHAEVSDQEHSNEELTYAWEHFLHHNTHFHEERPDPQPTTAVSIAPVGCNGEIYYYRVRLTVTDPEGLSSFDEKNIYPNCDGNFFEALNLKAQINEDDIGLEWTITSEDSLAYFDIQRSANNFHYETIGRVLADEAYRFTDNAPLFGEGYYRLKVFDQNKSFDYSNVAAVKYPLPNSLSVFPNPASDQANFLFTEDHESIHFEIFDMAGKLIVEGDWENIQAFIPAQLDTRSLAHGVYIYRITIGEQSFEDQLLIGK